MSIMEHSTTQYNFFSSDEKKIIQDLGKEVLLENLKKMMLIRNFEIRAEDAYLHGEIGGFFHSYIGQEAIQTAALQALGPDHWWIDSYRCHALALLLGATTDEVMSELFGRANGNAKGRGGSMHLYTDRMLGGFGIVSGQVPVAAGAGFALKYQEVHDQVAICFLGDGAVAQGSFHEALNLASLWDLPCIYVIENNQWGMGTSVHRAICVDHLAEDKAAGYNMKGYTFDGMDFFNCYAGFQHVLKETLETSRPVLIETVCERFKGHSISDPGLYRSKAELKECKQRDPILHLKEALIEANMISEDQFHEIDKEMRQKVVDSVHHAENSPWPDPIHLEEDVFAP